MRLLQKILLATDFDDASRAALETATRIAREFESEIVLIHVIREVPDAPSGLRFDAIGDSVGEELGRTRDALAAEGIPVAEPIIAEGPPFQRILDHATAQGVNLIVVGAGREVRPGQVHLSQTAERLARRSAKPVWVVRPGTKAAPGSIVCPVDFSSHSARALKSAIHLARRFGSRLTILKVVEPLQGFFGKAFRPDPALQKTHFEAQHRRLDEFTRRLDTHGVSVERRIREGSPAEQIVAAAREEAADLIVMGSAGRSGISRFFLGSAAGAVLRQLPCSVVTVKAEDAIRADFVGEVQDLRDRFKRGVELLDRGFPEEALLDLQAYLDVDPICPPAWDAVATAHERLGRKDETERCRGRAKQIRDELWKRTVEAEVRRHHPLWKHLSR